MKNLINRKTDRSTRLKVKKEMTDSFFLSNNQFIRTYF